MVIDFECQKFESDGYYNERGFLIIPGCENFFAHNNSYDIYIKVDESDTETLNGIYNTLDNCVKGQAFHDSPNEFMDAKINMEDFSLEVSVCHPLHDKEGLQCITKKYILSDNPSANGLCSKDSSEYSCIMQFTLLERATAGMIPGKQASVTIAKKILAE